MTELVLILILSSGPKVVGTTQSRALCERWRAYSEYTLCIRSTKV